MIEVGGVASSNSIHSLLKELLYDHFKLLNRFNCVQVTGVRLSSVFLHRVIHSGETLGGQVKGRSPKKLKSLTEVPYVVHVKVHVPSFNIILISSP